MTRKLAEPRYYTSDPKPGGWIYVYDRLNCHRIVAKFHTASPKNAKRQALAAVARLNKAHDRAG